MLRKTTIILMLSLPAVILVSCGADSSAPGDGAGQGGVDDREPTAQFRALRFEDETTERGLDFVHQTGRSGKRYILESLGSGAALFDCDNDGDLDALLLSGGPVKGSPRPKENDLYINDGSGHFERVPGARGLSAGSDYGVGCAVADVDQDGDLDVFITNYGLDKLYLNDGRGHFQFATESGITSALWGASCAFGDLNGDGLPDLYVCNYVDFDAEKHKPCFQRDIEVHCGPKAFLGQADCVFINLGAGRFKDGSREAFEEPLLGKGLGVAMADFDHDGDLDIYVANDQTPNFLFKNKGDATFEEIGYFAGVSVSKDGNYEAGMGVAFADYDNDGNEDIVVTNFESQVNSVYRNESADLFMDVAWETGIGYESRPFLGWGVGLIDFDSDGFKDLFFGNGHVYDNAQEVNDSTSFRQKNRLHINTGTGKFMPAKGMAVGGLDHAAATRGLAFGDVDGDGDVDILVLNVDDDARLLINQGTGCHAALVTTAHTVAKTPLLGARIQIRVGDQLQTQTVQGGYSFLTHNDTRVHFGLGSNPRIDSLQVTWVGGETQSYSDLPADRLIVLYPDGRAEIMDWKTRALETTQRCR